MSSAHWPACLLKPSAQRTVGDIGRRLEGQDFKRPKYASHEAISVHGYYSHVFPCRKQVCFQVLRESCCGIAPRAIALIDLLQAGISHLQRLPASITRGTICLTRKSRTSWTVRIDGSEKLNKSFGVSVSFLLE
jgi:hypothetical protein